MSNLVIFSFSIAALLSVTAIIVSPKISVCILVFLIPLSRAIIDCSFGASVLFMPILTVCFVVIIRASVAGVRLPIPPILSKILFCFCIFHVISLLIYWGNDVPAGVYSDQDGFDYTFAVRLHALRVFTGVALAWLIAASSESTSDVGLYLAAFLLSVIFLAGIVFVGNVFGVSLPEEFRPFYIILMPNERIIERTTVLYMGLRHSFTGYHGSHEPFAEYLFIIIVLSIILVSAQRGLLLAKCRKWSRYVVTMCYTSIASAAFFGLFVASKSFPVMILLWGLMLLIFSEKLSSRFRLISIGGIVIVLLLIISPYLKSSFFLQRFSTFHDRLLFAISTMPSKGGTAETLEIILGREGMITMAGSIFRTAGLFGGLPFPIYEFHGSVIPYHNGYYQILLNYGLLGLLVLLFLLLKVLRGLWLLRHHPVAGRPALLFLMLLLTLALEQLKVSVFRMTPSLLTFFFLIAVVTVYLRLNQLDTVGVGYSQTAPPLGPAGYSN